MYFLIWKSTANAQWYFVLKAANHEAICTSEGYWNKLDCLHGIELVQSSNGAPVYER